MMKHYSELEKISGTAIDVRNTGKNLFCPRRRRKYSERRKFYWHQGVYKNSQSVKYANVTIPAKGSAYLRRDSCGYVERSPLHFVLWLWNFSPWVKTYGEKLAWMYLSCKKTRNGSWPWCSAIGQKKTKVFWHQSEARTTPTVWNRGPFLEAPSNYRAR